MIREIAKKLFNDEAGVSPIVATLVLIVVAIAGAAAVGTIMGAFSSDVSDSSSSEGAANGASTELLIAGSTTVQPLSEVLAEKYMKANPGVKVTVQAGGSGAGIASTEMDIVDLGSASEAVDTVTAHPDLEAHQIGASAVVMIANGVNNTVPATAITALQVKTLYDAATGAGVVSTTNLSAAQLTLAAGSTATLYQREETGSGSEECFSNWASGSKTWMDTTKAVKVSGNAGVLKAVEDTPNSIGFVDFGYAEGSTAAKLINVGGGHVKTTVKAEALKTLKGTGTTFPVKLTRPLNYLTNGAPSTLEQSFIEFAKAPGQKDLFTKVGYFSMYDI